MTTALMAPPAPLGLTRGDRPTISVVIPYHRAADTITEAVRSLLDQTLRPTRRYLGTEFAPNSPERRFG